MHRRDGGWESVCWCRGCKGEGRDEIARWAHCKMIKDERPSPRDTETHRAASTNKDDGMIWIDECDMRRQMRRQDENYLRIYPRQSTRLCKIHADTRAYQQRNKDDIRITVSPSPSGRSVVLSPSLRRRLIWCWWYPLLVYCSHDADD